MKLLSAIALTILIALTLCAQSQQVATASATGPFTLRGGAVEPTGVPSWPVLAGDEISAQAVPVTLTFPDGSRIVLAPGARASVEQGADGRPVFRLLAGEALYDLRELNSVSLFAMNRAVTPPGIRGNYSGGPARQGGTFWTARNTALVLGAAGGAAAVIGVAATSGTDSVSPRR